MNRDDYFVIGVFVATMAFSVIGVLEVWAITSTSDVVFVAVSTVVPAVVVVALFLLVMFRPETVDRLRRLAR